MGQQDSWPPPVSANFPYRLLTKCLTSSGLMGLTFLAFFPAGSLYPSVTNTPHSLRVGVQGENVNAMGRTWSAVAPLEGLSRSVRECRVHLTCPILVDTPASLYQLIGILRPTGR